MCSLLQLTVDGKQGQGYRVWLPAGQDRLHQAGGRGTGEAASRRDPGANVPTVAVCETIRKFDPWRHVR